MKADFFPVYRTADCCVFHPISNLRVFKAAYMTKNITEGYDKEPLAYSDFHFSNTIFQSLSSTVCLGICHSVML